MTPGEARVRLERLDAEAKEVRKEQGWSQPGEVVWKGDTADTEVIVEADGFGGAAVMEVEGNWPVDFMNKRSQECGSEDEACRIASEWCGYSEDEEDEEDDAA